MQSVNQVAEELSRVGPVSEGRLIATLVFILLIWIARKVLLRVV